MNFNILGRTGLRVSVVGLGAGGHSRLGLSQSTTASDSRAIVSRALELGINLIDTAEAYGTEPVIGQALKGQARDRVVLSSKYSLYEGTRRRKPAELEPHLDASLARLETDHLDIYHLHAVGIEDYQFAAEALAPELLKMREKGKIRFIGITEAFHRDPSHRALVRALMDNVWDVVMVGFNVLNQSARETVLAQCMAKNVGVLDMYAVRRALTHPAVLKEYLNDLLARGLVPPDVLQDEEPLGFLVHSGGAANLPDAAYRFVRHEPGIHCVLSGTGSLRHLEENVASMQREPLPPADVHRLRAMFAGVDGVSGD